MEYRKEKDSLGFVDVPADKYWAAQTQRSSENFKIGGQHMPIEVIRERITEERRGIDGLFAR